MIEISDFEFGLLCAVNRNARNYRNHANQAQGMINDLHARSVGLEAEVKRLKAALTAEKEAASLLVKDNGLISEDNKRQAATIAAMKRQVGLAEAAVKKLDGKVSEASRARADTWDKAQHYYSIAFGLFWQSAVLIAALRELAPHHPMFDVEDGTSKSLVCLLPLAAYETMVSATAIEPGKVAGLVEENKVLFAADTASVREVLGFVEKAREYGQALGVDA